MEQIQERPSDTIQIVGGSFEPVEYEFDERICEDLFTPRKPKVLPGGRSPQHVENAVESIVKQRTRSNRIGRDQAKINNENSPPVLKKAEYGHRFGKEHRNQSISAAAWLAEGMQAMERLKGMPQRKPSSNQLAIAMRNQKPVQGQQNQQGQLQGSLQIQQQRDQLRGQPQGQVQQQQFQPEDTVQQQQGGHDQVHQQPQNVKENDSENESSMRVVDFDDQAHLYRQENEDSNNRQDNISAPTDGTVAHSKEPFNPGPLRNEQIMTPPHELSDEQSQQPHNNKVTGELADRQKIRPRHPQGVPQQRPVSAAKKEQPRRKPKLISKAEGQVIMQESHISPIKQPVTINDAHFDDTFTLNFTSSQTDMYPDAYDERPKTRASIKAGAPNSFSHHERTSKRWSAKRNNLMSSPAVGDGTQISFSVAKTKLVDTLNNCYAGCTESELEKFQVIDISDKGLLGLEGLDEFCPRLLEVDVSTNELEFLNGCPTSVLRLIANQNKLSSMTNLNVFSNLHYLDISDNEIESLSACSGMIHLRTLICANNRITSIEDIRQLRELQTLDASGNKITTVDFFDYNLQHLSRLNLKNNQIRSIATVSNLEHLISLNLDNNTLLSLDIDTPLEFLKTLKICNNEIQLLDIKKLPALSKLHVDKNPLVLADLDSLSQISQFSARSLKIGFGDFTACHLLNVKTIFFQGNMIRHLSISERFLSLQHLELEDCHIRKLPEDFVFMFPNLRYLNLNHNKIKDITPLMGLNRLKMLEMNNNSLEVIERFEDCFRSFRSLVALDVSQNPATSHIQIDPSDKPSVQEVTQREHIEPFIDMMLSWCPNLRLLNDMEILPQTPDS